MKQFGVTSTVQGGGKRPPVMPQSAGHYFLSSLTGYINGDFPQGLIVAVLQLSV
jgi:hypothetical protein